MTPIDNCGVWLLPFDGYWSHLTPIDNWWVLNNPRHIPLTTACHSKQMHIIRNDRSSFETTDCHLNWRPVFWIKAIRIDSMALDSITWCGQVIIPSLLTPTPLSNPKWQGPSCRGSTAPWEAVTAIPLAVYPHSGWPMDTVQHENPQHYG